MDWPCRSVDLRVPYRRRAHSDSAHSPPPWWFREVLPTTPTVLRSAAQFALFSAQPDRGVGRRGPQVRLNVVPKAGQMWAHPLLANERMSIPRVNPYSASVALVVTLLVGCGRQAR